MAIGDCADCGGYDVEWMYACRVHKGVEFCRGCECPYCAEEDGDDEYPQFDIDEEQQEKRDDI